MQWNSEWQVVRGGEWCLAMASELLFMSLFSDSEDYSGDWWVAHSRWWGVRRAWRLANGKMSLHVWFYVYESVCWPSISVTPSIFGPIRPNWTGPKRFRPVQSRSRKIGDRSEPGLKISRNGLHWTWTDLVRTGQLLDWWNHFKRPAYRTNWIIKCPPNQKTQESSSRNRRG